MLIVPSVVDPRAFWARFRPGQHGCRPWPHPHARGRSNVAEDLTIRPHQMEWLSYGGKRLRNTVCHSLGSPDRLEFDERLSVPALLRVARLVSVLIAPWRAALSLRRAIGPLFLAPSPPLLNSRPNARVIISAMVVNSSAAFIFSVRASSSGNRTVIFRIGGGAPFSGDFVRHRGIMAERLFGVKPYRQQIVELIK